MHSARESGAAGDSLHTELSPSDRARLRAIAHGSVACAAATGEPLAVTLSEEPPALSQPRATFVTLKRKGVLRGCMGSVTARAPLAVDAADNAAAAALRDPRFAPLGPHEVESTHVSVSVLSPLEDLAFSSEEDLLLRLRPGIDGLVLRSGARRALFLPQVWSQLGEPLSFVRALQRKGGLPPGPLGVEVTAERFTVDVVD